MSFIEKLKVLSKAQQKEAVEELLYAGKDQIEDSEEFIDRAAETNAQPFDVDAIDVQSFQIGTIQITGKATFGASGEQDEEKPSNATELAGEFTFTIDADEGTTLSDLSVTLDYGDDDDEPNIIVDDEDQDE